MTSYDGKTVTYDAIGNPLTYDGWNYTWEMGRQLTTMSGNEQNLSFKYNDAGIRTEKTVNGITTKYHLNGDKVTHEDNGTDKIYYTYDTNDNLISMNLNGTEYYYIRNGQNDIIGLFDSTGNQVLSYTYDTWGKLVSTTGSLAATVGVKNPYRFRGYRYDNETELYYCQSRYYSPEWGRWLNADAVSELKVTKGKLLSHNLFTYCLNNPVCFYDPNGDIVWILPILGYMAVDALLTAVLATTAVVLTVATVDKAIDLVKEKTKKQKEVTIIYRLGSGNGTNLTPRDIDITGLSYTTIQPKSGPYTVTSIEAINATGVLIAVQDSPTHVSVLPINVTQMHDWIKSRPNANTNPHFYTEVLMGVSVKVK